MPEAFEVQPQMLSWLGGGAGEPVDAVLAALAARVPGRIGPTLDRMRDLCELLDHPERVVPVLHITGTNGKTSSTRIAAALFEELGLAAGVYTSPHLEDVRERIVARGEPIGATQLGDLWRYLEPFLRIVDARYDVPVTFFEVLTALGLLWFQEAAVHVNVLEVGMGGTWDATNVADGQVALLTRVDLDHPQLGSTAEQIAKEKAGIIKPGAIAVSQVQAPEVLAVLEERVRSQGAQLLLSGRDMQLTDRRAAVGGQLLSVQTPAGRLDDLFLPLLGRHQAHNALVALTAVEAMLGGRLLDVETVRRALAGVRSPGRMEVIGRSPLILLDGAHNPAGARALAAALEDELIVGQRILVLGCLADKDIHGILAELALVADRVIVTESGSDRSASTSDLAAAAAAVGVRAVEEANVVDALQRARELADPHDAIVVTGSLTVVGEARRALRPGA